MLSNEYALQTRCVRITVAESLQSGGIETKPGSFQPMYSLCNLTLCNLGSAWSTRPLCCQAAHMEL